MKKLRFARISLAALVTLSLAACKSYWIQADVINNTGQTIHELEVDYPTASFGTNLLAPGASMHYRFQVRGSGPVKVEYTSPDGKTSHATGLALNEHQQGQITIQLLPAGKAQFQQNLQPGR